MPPHCPLMPFHCPLSPSHCPLIPPHRPLELLLFNTSLLIAIRCLQADVFTLSMFDHLNPTELDYPVKIKPNTR